MAGVAPFEQFVHPFVESQVSQFVKYVEHEHEPAVSVDPFSQVSHVAPVQVAQPVILVSVAQSQLLPGVAPFEQLVHPFVESQVSQAAK